MPAIPSRLDARTWMAAALQVTLLVYVYVFLEWLFFVTKPSFMSVMKTTEQVGILMSVALGLALLCLAPIAVLGLLDLVPAGRWVKVFLGVLRSTVPALILASLGFIALDNFTYTVFEFGVVSTFGAWRLEYALLFIAMLLLAWRETRRDANPPETVFRRRLLMTVALLAASLLFTGARLVTQPPPPKEGATLAAGSGGLPDIILFGADGLNASHLQVYGYARATSPTLAALSADSLMAENAFPNGGNSSGSIASLLTGRLPTETGLIFAPDILGREDAYRHLPGLLRQLGYTSAQFTIRHYADAEELNFLDGFEEVNFRRVDNPVQAHLLRLLGGTTGRYFAEMILERLRERLEHAFMIRTMTDPYDLVTRPITSIGERQRLEGLIAFLDETDGPTFAHVHMMGTHGSRFQPQHTVFSADLEQDADWMTDFYDDAVLDFDSYVGELVGYLQQTSRLESTLLIIYSDHGMNWQTTERVPLLMRFPGAGHRGVINHNVQNVDIAPTILDYLGVQRPAWMGGVSLLEGEPPAVRPIFAATVSFDVLEQYQLIWSVDQGELAPPFYQLGRLTVVACDRWYALDLPGGALAGGQVGGHTDPCGQGLTEQEARALLLNRLEQDGYDVTSLRPK